MKKDDAVSTDLTLDTGLIAPNSLVTSDATLENMPDFNIGYPEGQQMQELVRRAIWCRDSGMALPDVFDKCQVWNLHNLPPISGAIVLQTCNDVAYSHLYAVSALVNRRSWNLKSAANGRATYRWDSSRWPFDVWDALRGRKRYIRSLMVPLPQWKIAELIAQIEGHSGSLDAKNSEIWAGYKRLHGEMLNGDANAALTIFWMIEDWARLRFCLYAWGLHEDGRISGSMWGELLREVWQRGKGGCLLLYAKLDSTVITKMFQSAHPEHLMNRPGEYQHFKEIGRSVVVWRGISSACRYKANGMSWTTNREQAEWFAYRNNVGAAKSILIGGMARREDILAAFDYEREIIVKPGSKVAVFTRLDLHPSDRGARMAELRGIIRGAAVPA